MKDPFYLSATIVISVVAVCITIASVFGATPAEACAKACGGQMKSWVQRVPGPATSKDEPERCECKP